MIVSHLIAAVATLGAAPVSPPPQTAFICALASEEQFNRGPASMPAPNLGFLLAGSSSEVSIDASIETADRGNFMFGARFSRFEKSADGGFSVSAKAEDGTIWLMSMRPSKRGPWYQVGLGKNRASLFGMCMGLESPSAAADFSRFASGEWTPQ